MNWDEDQELWFDPEALEPVWIPKTPNSRECTSLNIHVFFP